MLNSRYSMYITLGNNDKVEISNSNFISSSKNVAAIIAYNISDLNILNSSFSKVYFV